MMQFEEFQKILRESNFLPWQNDNKAREEFLNCIRRFAGQKGNTDPDTIRIFDANMPTMTRSERVFRGMNFEKLEGEMDFIKNKIITFKNYASTSFKYDVAKDFLDEWEGSRNHQAIFIIDTLKGARWIDVSAFFDEYDLWEGDEGFDIDDYNFHYIVHEEQEVILDRGSQFQVIKYEDKGKKSRHDPDHQKFWHVWLRQVK